MKQADMQEAEIVPMRSGERYVIPDMLRGFALLGICLANYSEFSLYSFLPREATATLPTAHVDSTVRFLQYLFVDGKFYTLFSLLFGMGFSIILGNAARKGANGLKIFYRRTVILFFIGLAHLLFLWAGDILILYALMGMLLPLFLGVSNRALLRWALLLLLFPIVIDAVIDLWHWNLSAPAIRATEYFHHLYGITPERFPVWLAEQQTYADVLRFNTAGSFIRLQEFIDGNRPFKVLALFLLGLYIGRKQLYARPGENKKLFKQVLIYGTLVGLPASVLYAYEATHAHPFGLALHSVIYTVSVLPLALAYAAALCLLYLHRPASRLFTALAAPGRMALTNYLMQSVLGMLIFYGIGMEWGARTGLVYVELIALGVFVLQLVASRCWLHYMQFGPFEWVWRMLTYGKLLKLLK
ncbi:MAG: DUF418 domain-containing protein [Prevotellaceae bacterium]|jgi:uncharacterized protein|nr:DUF418 domain-containing protein [Prevotellaceae bacterium]